MNDEQLDRVANAALAIKELRRAQDWCEQQLGRTDEFVFFGDDIAIPANQILSKEFRKAVDSCAALYEEVLRAAMNEIK